LRAGVRALGGGKNEGSPIEGAAVASELADLRVAFLIANEGAEQVELTSPWQAVIDAGGNPVLVAPEPGTAQAFRHLDRGDTFPVDVTVADALGQQFDALVLPGGVANPDRLRTIPDAVRFTRSFFEAGRPVAVICHGPWTLIDAGVVRDRAITSWPSLKTDLMNAGAEWVDEEVRVDTDGPNTLVSSRKPDDLPAFNRTLVREFSAHRAGARA
jgi:protease I